MSVALALAAFVAAGPGTAAEPARLAEARSLLLAKRHEEAARAFAAANHDAGGRCGACLVGEADARLSLRDFGAARKAAAKATRLPGCDPALLAQAHVIVGMALYREGGEDQRVLRDAADSFRAALAAAPDDPTARFNLGATLLKLSRDEEGVAVLKAFLEKAPDAPGADRARAFIANPRRARERFAPDFAIRTMQGEEISLASLRGRSVLVDFWGSWCGPCVQSLPELKQLVNRYSDRLTVLSVSVHDEEPRWRSFVASHAMTWPQYRDADGSLAQRFGVSSFPTYVLVDGDGAVVQTLSGFDDRHSVGYRLRRTLEPLLRDAP